jgi:hypothetical protein
MAVWAGRSKAKSRVLDACRQGKFSVGYRYDRMEEQD